MLRRHAKSHKLPLKSKNVSHSVSSHDYKKDQNQSMQKNISFEENTHSDCQSTGPSRMNKRKPANSISALKKRRRGDANHTENTRPNNDINYAPNSTFSIPATVFPLVCSFNIGITGEDEEKQTEFHKDDSNTNQIDTLHTIDQHEDPNTSIPVVEDSNINKIDKLHTIYQHEDPQSFVCSVECDTKSMEQEIDEFQLKREMFLENAQAVQQNTQLELNLKKRSCSDDKSHTFEERKKLAKIVERNENGLARFVDSRYYPIKSDFHLEIPKMSIKILKK